jgi:predicted regulator of Ras-like GTPase activity (Roadblock/LC7/MglB family)
MTSRPGEYKQSNENKSILRSGLSLYPSHYAAIDQALLDLTRRIPATLVLLADVTGQVVSARGEQGPVDLVALASLIAGDMAASQEISRLTGEYQNYQLILREGRRMHTFISEAGHYLVLLVQVTKDVPLGWARLLILEAARYLADIAAAPAASSEDFQVDLQQDELPDLFSSALDELWTE